MKKIRRPRWAAVVALASAGLLSGCYYYPYGYYPWGYPYPSPYPYTPGGAYPYPPPPPPPAGLPNTAPETAQPGNAPVQRTPLPLTPQ